MADALSLWRDSSLDGIERDLAALWRDAASEGPLSRAVMTNLIVISEGHDRAQEVLGEEYAALAGEVAQRHPVRAILLERTPASAAVCDEGRTRVGLQTVAASTARYGVELIAIRVACAADSIPSIVRRLSRGSLPTAVWWTGDLSRTPPADLTADLGRQFLYDSAPWHDAREGLRVIARLMARPRAPDVADLNWRRLAPIREAIRQGLASEPGARELPARGVDIRYGAAGAASALLVAGWLHCRLHWPSGDAPRIEGGGDSAEALSVTMRSADWTVGASMGGSSVRVSGTNQPAVEKLLPRETIAEAVVAELRSLGFDARYREAVAAASVLAQ